MNPLGMNICSQGNVSGWLEQGSRTRGLGSGSRKQDATWTGVLLSVRSLARRESREPTTADDSDSGFTQSATSSSVSPAAIACVSLTQKARNQG